MTHEHKQRIALEAAIQEALSLCIQIQNKGIATVFFRLHGHIANLQIDLHAPVWVSGRDKTEELDFYCDAEEISESADHRAVKLINRLKQIIEDGKVCDTEEIEQREKEERRKLFLSLKHEFEIMPAEIKREKAIKWWKDKSEANKKELCRLWLPSFVNPSYVTGLQIEIIYENAIGKKESDK